MPDEHANRRPIPARKSRHSAAFASWLAGKDVTPNQISLFGLAVGVGSGVALALTPQLPDFARLLLVASAIMVLLRGLSNMFDGMVAVEQGRASPTGLLYNEIPDRLSDVALFAGAGYAVGSDPMAGWAAACVALMVTCIRLVGTIAGAPADFGGPMAKQQRMFSIAAVSFYLGVTPEAWHPGFGADGAVGLLALVLWIIVIGGIYTCIVRTRRAAIALNAASPARQTTSNG
ncbi:CDP-alcohol phosphatidyltransferase family protein [Aestuariivirga sp.]|uniref:CDP-alcohol phosphatidyltransferase family protein n=1 Tax=Aestuariivirga sp. TaxID=2650926 RepID=UPI00391D483E